jgi:membrane associated rhomboid family serine protease
MIPLRDTMPSHSSPFVTVFLIAANTLVFLYMVTLDPYTANEFVHTYAVVPADLHYSSLLTSMFLHGGWMHLIGNMWFLWIYGDNVEDVLGHGKYIAFYLICGVIAALAQYVANSDSRIPMLGASGAVAGVMGAYLVKFPHARVLTLIPIVLFWTTVEIPAVLILAYWFILQFFSGVGSIAYSEATRGGGVAYLAHVGGFLAGMLLIVTMKTRRRYSHRTDAYW